MLTNPHIDAVTKASVATMFASAIGTAKLRKTYSIETFALAASSAGAAGGGFITPTKGPGQALSEHDTPGGSASTPCSCCSK